MDTKGSEIVRDETDGRGMGRLRRDQGSKRLRAAAASLTECWPFRVSSGKDGQSGYDPIGKGLHRNPMLVNIMSMLSLKRTKLD